MKRRRKGMLPAIPSGMEKLEMTWRDATPRAVGILAPLPIGADDAWATADGWTAFWASLLRAELARRELSRTPSTSALLLSRRRAVERCDRLSKQRALNIAGAILRQARADWPRAKPEQLLLLRGERSTALALESAARLEA